ncbi:hypothetical protein JXI42_05030, partial [bacterium]|nr:hypothetical protein [bacterium]
QKNVPEQEYNNYLKWLRYYIDFCKKYRHTSASRDSLPLFIKKLQGERKRYHLYPTFQFLRVLSMLRV